jgi:hypothetical protein
MEKQNRLSSILCRLARDVYTRASTFEALAKAYGKARECAQVLDVHSARYILFSDHHRGAKNGADDFRACEAIYCAALNYYFEMGYTLCNLGDSEELWEERPSRVMVSNDASFSAERTFHEQGRYFRLFGNHDDEWEHHDRVEALLQSKYGDKPLAVRESMLLRVMDGKNLLGEILLLHGHQGTQNEGAKNWLPKMALRYLWRPFQQLTRLSCNTPATDWEIRDDRDELIYEWVSQKPGLILIAGHTHAPVFTSRSHKLRLLEDIYKARQLLAKTLEDQTGKRDNLRKKIAELSAELVWLERKMSEGEWLKWEKEKQNWLEKGEIKDPKPCYFNTGCCSFSDAKITGIEIADGSIRLVRWPGYDGKPNPTSPPLREESLEGVFKKLQEQPREASKQQDG